MRDIKIDQEGCHGVRNIFEPSHMYQSTFDSASLLLGYIYIYIYKRDPKIHVCILYAKYF